VITIVGTAGPILALGPCQLSSIVVKSKGTRSVNQSQGNVLSKTLLLRYLRRF